MNRVKSILDQIDETPNVKLIVCMEYALPKEIEHEANKHSISILPFSQVEVGEFVLVDVTNSKLASRYLF